MRGRLPQRNPSSYASWQSSCFGRHGTMKPGGAHQTWRGALALRRAPVPEASWRARPRMAFEPYASHAQQQKRLIQMKELKLNPVDGPALSEELYALALAPDRRCHGLHRRLAGGGRACPLGRDRRPHERTSG